MGVETEEEYSGANCSFTSAIITIEELAKVDPSVSVLCDVQVNDDMIIMTMHLSHAWCMIEHFGGYPRPKVWQRGCQAKISSPLGHRYHWFFLPL